MIFEWLLTLGADALFEDRHYGWTHAEALQHVFAEGVEPLPLKGRHISPCIDDRHMFVYARVLREFLYLPHLIQHVGVHVRMEALHHARRKLGFAHHRNQVREDLGVPPFAAFAVIPFGVPPSAACLHPVAVALVEQYAPDAPAPVQTEAAIRTAGWLAESPHGPIRSKTTGDVRTGFDGARSMGALRHSGGMGLLSRRGGAA